MLKSIEMTGPTRDIAIQNALEQLGMERDDVSVEVLDNGKKGFLGFGATDARVRISYEAPDEPASVKPAPQKAVPTKTAAEKPAPSRPMPAQPVQPEISADDPRRTTPHLVKSASQKAEQVEDKPARTRPPREERAPRQRENTRCERRPADESRPDRAPVVPFIDPVPMATGEISAPAAEAVKFIDGLLEKLEIEGKATVLASSEPGHIRIDIAGEDMGPVIGRRGDTLDAIQYLSSLVLNRFSDDHVRLTIDTENYRAKRAQSLERLARKMALKVCKYHKAMTLEPMNPYERRIIHAALQDFRGVTTHSTGSEPGRRVVISPEGASRAPRRPFKPRSGNASRAESTPHAENPPHEENE